MYVVFRIIAPFRAESRRGGRCDGCGLSGPLCLVSKGIPLTIRKVFKGAGLNKINCPVDIIPRGKRKW
jgi:hypothetical protein